MKMKTIRISEEVWNAMALRGKFGETPDDVLRRVLIGDRQIHVPDSANFSTGTTKSNSTSFTTKPSGWKERRAKVALTQTQEGNFLVFRFAGGTERKFELPPRNDKAAIRRLRDDAVAWAHQNGATDGQQGAVMRALTSRGFHITK